MAVVLVIVVPVAVVMSGALAAAALGWALTDDADHRYRGSELVALDR